MVGFKFLYTSLYAVLMVVFLIQTIIFMRTMNYDKGTEREVGAFKRMCLCFCFYLILKGLVALQRYQYIRMGRTASWLLARWMVMDLFLCEFFWFWFVEYQVLPKVIYRWWWRAVSAIPLFLVIALLTVNGSERMLFYMENQGMVQGKYYFLIILISEFCLLVPTIHSLIAQRHERRMQRRRLFRTLFWIALIPAACIALQMRIPGTPMIAIGIMTTIILVFVAAQSSQIYTDMLTGIGNRRRMEERFDDWRGTISEKNPYIFCVMDIDHFKSINDLYSHLTGDWALRIISEGLMRLMRERTLCAVRWGGDEFVLFGPLSGFGTVEAAKDEIRTSIREVCKEDRFDIPLELSIGVVRSLGDKVGTGNAVTVLMESMDSC